MSLGFLRGKTGDETAIATVLKHVESLLRSEAVVEIQLEVLLCACRDLVLGLALPVCKIPVREKPCGGDTIIRINRRVAEMS